ncbi:hypothetical protein T484DRAFT_1843840, partial [Baffinella frigidus]
VITCSTGALLDRILTQIAPPKVAALPEVAAYPEVAALPEGAARSAPQSPKAKLVLASAEVAEGTKVAANTKVAAATLVLVGPISEPQRVLAHLLEARGRSITPEQAAAVDAALAAAKHFEGEDENEVPSPLWLRMVAASVSSWRSFDGVRHPILGSVQKLVETSLYRLEEKHGGGYLVETTLYRLEEKHGGYLVRAALSFFLSSATQGLAEGEMRHLLSLDDDVLADCYEWWIPPVRTLPGLLLSQLLIDLDPYLARRGDASGMLLLSWGHRQLLIDLDPYLARRGDASGMLLLFWGHRQIGLDPFLARRGDASGMLLLSWGHRQFQHTAQMYRGDEGEQAARHRQLFEYFSGRWAGVPKPYSPWLSAVIQH